VRASYRVERRHEQMEASHSGLPYQRVEMEHALKAAHGLQREGAAWRSVELARSLGLDDALASNIAQALIASGWAEENGSGGMRLTATGEARAVELIRAHRLWERYLVDREGMPLDAVHTEAHYREHETTPEELEELDAELGYPAWDPHGHAIPASGYRVPSPAGQSLLEVAIPGSRLRVVRLDDEPVALLTQLVALGLEPGAEIDVSTLQSKILWLEVAENVVPLSYDAATHVFVVPAPVRPVPMGELAVGSRAQVVELTGRGNLQRRMLSMGFVPGAEVTVIREAPLGDPLQYRVKNANVALRRDEANTLLVRELRNGSRGMEA
jgi:Fe2+ transport system protein FeoA/Mn-dependent DtxR family transcriptional regulator